jgi:hypothetical protein
VRVLMTKSYFPADSQARRQGALERDLRT